jgi:hypothetical protein
MRADLPTSLAGWEEALARRFLTAAGEGGALFKTTARPSLSVRRATTR